MMGTQSEDFCEIDWHTNQVRHHCHAYPDGTITEMNS